MKTLNLKFSYCPVTYGEIKDGIIEPTEFQSYVLQFATRNDHNFGEVLYRIENRKSSFTDRLVWDDEVLTTITTGSATVSGDDKGRISNKTIINAQTFPQDYNFNNKSIKYVCGMSVPPLMMKRVVDRLIEQGVFYETD